MVEKLIKKVARQLDKAKIPYMIIGGQAVLLYGRPRLTRDIDITLGIDTDQFELIGNICKKLKLKTLPKIPEDFAKNTKVFPVAETKLKIRVDFIFSFTPYEEQAIKRAKKVIVSGYPARFASREDVIIHKMFAGRAIDEEDIKSILLKSRKSINFAYVKKWLLKFSKLPGQRSLLAKFNSVLRSI